MEEDLTKKYQTAAQKVLARNKSVTDILSKLQCAGAKTARCVVKAATGCGCVSLCAKKGGAGNGIQGELCGECKTEIEIQMGEMLFYTASLCTALGIALEDVIRRDMERADMMGKYSLR